MLPLSVTLAHLASRVYRVSTDLRWLALLLALGLIAAGNAGAQCPAVGADTTCGVVITVIQTSNSPCPPQGCASISFTGQGPYDQIEDTLVGVVNNGNLPITSLILKSSVAAFAFDGDGICGLDPNTGVPFVPRPAGCPFGPTGYEGPGVSFSNISPDGTTGTVNFNPAIPPGGTAYFSLEESLTAATACSTVINGSVPKPTPGGSPTITTAFTPNSGFNLAQAANLCGFSGWDWQQTVTLLPAPSPFKAAGTTTPLVAPPPFLDPPPGGYVGHPPDHSYPFYLDPNSGELQSQEPGGLVLNFTDTPTDRCLPGGNGAPCGGMTAPAGSKIGFTTHLVGLVGFGPGFGVQDTGIGFSWTSTYNGTSGGTDTTKNLMPVDPGSGTGGTFVTNYSATTNYQFPKGLGVTAINGVSTGSSGSPTLTLLGAGQASVVASGLAFSRVTQTFNGTLTLINTGSASIAGPFQIVLDSLTTGVTLANATSTFGGWSYITVPSTASLAPGASASVTVQFSNPGNVVINFSPVPYSGSFN
jgi:hypothetical protein